MTLKELKAKLDAAAAELAKKSDDAALVAAHDKAKSEYEAALAAAHEDDDADDEDEDENKGKGKKPGKLDLTTLSPEAQKLIKDLRKENADSRKKNKELSESHVGLKKALVEAGVIEEADEKPEEKLKTVSQGLANSQTRIAILEATIEHGVSKDDSEYFAYLINKAANELEEGEELAEDEIAEIAKKAKRNQASGSTSVNGKGGKKDPDGKAETTLDEFIRMTMGQKSELYTSKPELYAKLMAEARAKRKIV